MKVRVEVKVFWGHGQDFLMAANLSTNKQRDPSSPPAVRMRRPKKLFKPKEQKPKAEKVQAGKMEVEKKTLARLRVQLNKLEKEEEQGKIELETIMSEQSEISSQKSIDQLRISRLQEIIQDCQRGIDEHEDKIRRGKCRKAYLEGKRKKTTLKLTKLEMEVRSVRKEVKKAEKLFPLKGEDESKLCRHLDNEIKELVEELQCPVCLEVISTAPIYKCSNEHLICR